MTVALYTHPLLKPIRKDFFFVIIFFFKGQYTTEIGQTTDKKKKKKNQSQFERKEITGRRVKGKDITTILFAFRILFYMTGQVKQIAKKTKRHVEI